MGIIVFATSLGFLTIFLGITFYERVHKHSVYALMQKKGDMVVEKIFFLIKRKFLYIFSYFSIQQIRTIILKKIALLIVHVARRIENHAQEVTRKMGHPNGVTKKTTSVFLQKVTSHKQSLDIERIKRETSLASHKKTDNE